MRLVPARLAASLALVAAACSGPAIDPPAEPPASADGPGRVLTFGSVSLDPAREHEVFEPFVDSVCARLGDVGIGRGRVVVVDSLNRMVEEIRRGAVDVFIDSPFPVIFVDQRSDLRILARRWKRRSAVYRGVLFARSDSGIDSVEALRGRMVAFGAPYSTSSFLLPKAELGIMGFELDPYQDAAASVPSDRIGYLFSDDAETTMFWVLKNKVAAGSVNRDYYRELAGIRAEELKIVHVTRELPRNLVAVRGDLEPEIGHRLLEVLLALDRSAEGRQVLAAFEETVRFDGLPGGPEGVRLEMAELIPHVEEDLGQ